MAYWLYLLESPSFVPDHMASITRGVGSVTLKPAFLEKAAAFTGAPIFFDWSITVPALPVVAVSSTGTPAGGVFSHDSTLGFHLVISITL